MITEKRKNCKQERIIIHIEDWTLCEPIMISWKIIIMGVCREQQSYIVDYMHFYCVQIYISL